MLLKSSRHHFHEEKEMATYTAKIVWERNEQVFLDNRYSRKHRIIFDGGFEVPASSSPSVVPLPYSDATAVDPEEMFVASISNCHMLWFLSIAAKHNYCVDRYEDNPIGIMKKNEQGKLFIAEVILHPQVEFSGEKFPTKIDIEKMHETAHEECFIANSVKTSITYKLD